MKQHCKNIKALLLTGLIFTIYNLNLLAAPVTTNNKSVLEVVRFTVKKGVSDEHVHNLATSITPILKKYPGFISRTLANDVHREQRYIDIVKWKSFKDVSNAANKIIDNKKMKQFIRVMKSYKMYHFNLVS